MTTSSVGKVCGDANDPMIDPAPQEWRHLTDFVLTPGHFAAPGVHIGRASQLGGLAGGHGVAPARLAGRTLMHCYAAPLLTGLANRHLRLAGVLRLSAYMLARFTLELSSSALVLSCVAPMLVPLALELFSSALVLFCVAPVLDRFALGLSCSALGRFGAAPVLAGAAARLFAPAAARACPAPGLAVRAATLAASAPGHASRARRRDCWHVRRG